MHLLFFASNKIEVLLQGMFYNALRIKTALDASVKFVSDVGCISRKAVPFSRAICSTEKVPLSDTERCLYSYEKYRPYGPTKDTP